MKFWNYIGEFFLFRWLFSKLRATNREQENTTAKSDEHFAVDHANENTNSIADEESGSVVEPSINDKLDLDENVEELDDLDIFMRNYKPRKYSSTRYQNFSGKYHRSSSDNSDNNFDNCFDWDNRDYNQSFNDFHEEQDDFDMMDDF